MSLIIDTPNGQRTVTVARFGALDGVDLRARFIEFAASRDRDLRRKYTMEILRYAKVANGNQAPLPLTTGALIDNHLCTWQNVQLVFERVLSENGIDANAMASESDFWYDAGVEMFAAFYKSLSVMTETILGA